MNLWKDRRLRLAITSLGLQYIAALLMVGGFAVNTGNNLLYLVFGLMLGLFLVSGWVSRRALQGIRPVALDEGNLFARVRGGIRVRLSDRAPRRMRALEVRLEMEGGQIEPGFYPGGQGEPEALMVLHAKADRRGWTRLTALELRTTYPFGFLEKAWRFPLEKPVLVLPHPRTPPLLPPGPAGEPRRSAPMAGESSPEGARPHRPGDPPSRVHWKRTAQRGVPWVRTFETETPHGLALKLDLRHFGPGRPFERELEKLSGAVLQARLQKLDASLELLDSGGRQEFRGHTECWRAMALAEPEGDPYDAPTDHGENGAMATPAFFI